MSGVAAPRARMIFFIVVLALAASACAAILGIDDVSVRDSGADQDATVVDASSNDAAADGGAFVCNDPKHPHDFCADFEEGNVLSAFGSGGQTLVLNAVVDGGSFSLADAGNASTGALQVSTDTINPADAQVAESFLVYDSDQIGTTFVLDYDVQAPTNTAPVGGHIDYPILQIEAPDGGSAIQFYLAINAIQDAEVVAVNTGSTSNPAIVVPTSTFPDVGQWMHVELRVTLESSSQTKLLAFIGNGATTAVFDQTMSQTPVQGRVHLQLGLVASGSPTPQTSLQIDNVTLDTNN